MADEDGNEGVAKDLEKADDKSLTRRRGTKHYTAIDL